MLKSIMMGKFNVTFSIYVSSRKNGRKSWNKKFDKYIILEL